MENNKQLIEYNSSDGKINIEVNLDNETVWLSLNDLVSLFDRDKSVISRHIRNVFKEGELDKEATVAKYATVQNEGGREINRNIEFFNLDVIISVGYRVKSKQGTNFRIWATSVLRDRLIQNAKKTANAVSFEGKYLQLIKTINIAANAAKFNELSSTEATGILKVLQKYAYALETLDKYDHQQLLITGTTIGEVKELSYEEGKELIEQWSEIQNTGELFGREKDASFKSSIRSIYQTFDGKDVYPSIEEKGANLLYFIVKNHSFTDGNKRIAAGLFAYFLDKNNALFKSDGSKIIEDNALVAITIMIAESKSEEKDTMVKLVVNLINSSN
ncbi:RhuM family protein [Lutibacter sp.]|uniref:RhuM family protein n=1 Tax=Lutibacter sp. TaxID=1925666 RepID=UPI00356850C8